MGVLWQRQAQTAPNGRRVDRQGAAVVDAIRELYLDVVFGNGWIALGVVIAATVATLVARVFRPGRL